MTLNELIRNTKIWVSNEEADLLKKVNDLIPVDSFTQREQFVIENLVKKSLIIKTCSKGVCYVWPNK